MLLDLVWSYKVVFLLWRYLGAVQCFDGGYLVNACCGFYAPHVVTSVQAQRRPSLARPKRPGGNEECCESQPLVHSHIASPFATQCQTRSVPPCASAVTDFGGLHFAWDQQGALWRRASAQFHGVYLCVFRCPTRAAPLPSGTHCSV